MTVYPYTLLLFRISSCKYSRTSMTRTPLVPLNMFEAWVVRANEVNHSARSVGIVGLFFLFP